MHPRDPHFGAEFATRLRSVLGEQKQKDVANKLGILRPQLTRYCAGQIPEIRILLKIAKHFEVSIDWLLTGHNAPAGTHNAERDSSDRLPSLLTRSWKTLSSEHRETLARCHQIMLNGDRATRTTLIHDLAMRAEWIEWKKKEK